MVMVMVMWNRHRGLVLDSPQSHPDLLFDHRSILSTLQHQFGMTPRLTDLAILDDDNQVSTRDRTQAMSDHKTRSSPHQRSQTLLNQLLTFRIQIARRFIQNQ
jgi:hypothetical protein